MSNASVTLIHGMSRPIGAHFHVPHGLSNAMLLSWDLCCPAGLTGPLTFVGLCALWGSRLSGASLAALSASSAGGAQAEMFNDIS